MRLVLISTISPEIGAKISETAFTDSTVPIGPVCLILDPIVEGVPCKRFRGGFLSVVCYSYYRMLIFDADPFVVFGIVKLFGYVVAFRAHFTFLSEAETVERKEDYEKCFDKRFLVKFSPCLVA